MSKFTQDDFYDQLRSRVAYCTQERVQALWEYLETPPRELVARPELRKKLGAVWFYLDIGGQEYPILKIIPGYESPLAPGWIQFKPNRAEFKVVRPTADTFAFLLETSGLFRKNESDGLAFYELRVTDLDRDEARSQVERLSAWFVGALRQGYTTAP